MTIPLILTFAFWISLAWMVWLMVSAVRHHRVSTWGVAALAVCAVVIASCVWYFAPHRLEGYDAGITQQVVSWHGMDHGAGEAVCVQPERLPGGLQIRRYRLGDTPMPGHAMATRAAELELTLSDGKKVILMLCPDRPASSRIWLYDAPYGVSAWFLTEQSARRCLDVFLLEM